MEISDSFRSLYDDAKAYQLELDEVAPLTCELNQIDAEYKDKKLIATGGMKAIYNVFSVSCQRHVALAELSDPTVVDNFDPFICEARLTALLEHPNIIKVYDIGLNDQGEPFFTMELKHGSTLNQVLEKREKGQANDHENFKLAQLLNVFIKICDAMAYAHDQGVVHLDLKPENIQVGLFGEVLVCDWGLGKVIDKEQRSYDTQSFNMDILNNATLTGQVKGTPGYMAPEQLNNESKRRQTDIYSLGAILLTILRPERLVGMNTQAILEETKNGLPQALSDCREKAPKSLVSVIEKAMQKDPSQRYKTVSSLKNDIENYLNCYPTSFEKKDKFFCAWLFYKRHNLLCNLAFIVLLTLTLLITWYSQKIQTETQQRLVQETRAIKAESEMILAEDEIRRKSKEIFEIQYQSLEQKKAKADELNELAANIKSRTMYEKTMEAVNIMEDLSNLALTLDPDSHLAKHQIAEVHFIQLNTAETKKMLKHYTPSSSKLLKVYQDCPSLNFTRRKRPSKQQVIQFLKAMNYNEIGHILAQRVVLYDYELRSRSRTFKEYEAVIQAYFESGGKVMKSFFYDYDKTARRLILEGNKKDANSFGPRLFLTRFLDLDTLVLKGDFSNLMGLKSAKITTLDLSQHSPIPIIKMNHALINHPTLKTIFIKSGSYPESFINKFKSIYKIVIINS